MHKSHTFFLVSFLIAVFISSCSSPQAGGDKAVTDSTTVSVTADSSLEHEYNFRDLKTDFSKHAIPIDS
ncbi:MAG: hypothetical protein ABI729_11160, partial [Chitinophagales bacterium]